MTFSEVTEPERLLALTRRALVEASQPKVSYEVDVAALDGDDADLGDTVAVVDTSRDLEWRLTARVVRRVRTFCERVVARVTIGTVEPVDYAQVSALAADVATLRDNVVGIDASSVKKTCQWHVFSEKARALSERSHRALPPNMTTAASVTVVENTVTTTIDDLDELGELDF